MTQLGVGGGGGGGAGSERRVLASLLMIGNKFWPGGGLPPCGCWLRASSQQVRASAYVLMPNIMSDTLLGANAVCKLGNIMVVSDKKIVCVAGLRCEHHKSIVA